MGLDASKFLAVAAVVLGLVIFVVLLRATFEASAIFAPARLGEGGREGERCREE